MESKGKQLGFSFKIVAKSTVFVFYLMGITLILTAEIIGFKPSLSSDVCWVLRSLTNLELIF